MTFQQYISYRIAEFGIQAAVWAAILASMFVYGLVRQIVKVNREHKRYQLLLKEVTDDDSKD